MTTLQITLTDDVGQKVSEVAESQHLSIEELMTIALMEKMSSIPDPVLERRAARGRREDFDTFMAHVPDVPADEHDRLD